MLKSGILGKSYHQGRKTKKSLKYRLLRRTQEVTEAIDTFSSSPPRRIVDLGAADGLALGEIKEHFPAAHCIGVEYLLPLLEENDNPSIAIMQSDITQLPIKNSCCDVAVLSAVIGYIREQQKALAQVSRTLKPGGLLVVTSPDPFWLKAATLLGHVEGGQDYLMGIEELAGLMQSEGFEILEQKKFMLSPIGMPFERGIESLLRKIGLNFLFANQLVVGRKSASA